METLLNVLSVLGGLAMFLYGMALMSEGLQKSAGDRLRAFMARTYRNCSDLPCAVFFCNYHHGGKFRERRTAYPR